MTLQTLARRGDVAELMGGYGLVVVDECHHIPAAAFEHAVKQIPARHWLGQTATPYRRDRLDDLIGLQLGPIRHTFASAEEGTLEGSGANLPTPLLTVHETSFGYAGDADPSAPGGMAAIYRDLVADDDRNGQIIEDVIDAIERGRNCLVLSQWTSHVDRVAVALIERGLVPVILKGGMSARPRVATMARLQPVAGTLLAVATGPYVGEGVDCPGLDTLFLTAPIAFKAASSSTPDECSAPIRQGLRGGPRLPRRQHACPCHVDRETSAWLRQPRVPRPSPGKPRGPTRGTERHAGT